MRGKGKKGGTTAREGESESRGGDEKVRTELFGFGVERVEGGTSTGMRRKFRRK